MIVKTLKSGVGSGRGLMYLVQDRDHEGRERFMKPEVIRGDMSQTIELVDSLTFKNRYTSFVLNFSEEDQLTPELEQKLLDDFKETLFPEMESSRIEMLAVKHQEQDRSHIHVIVPRVDLQTGKNLAPYVHGIDQKRLLNWQEIVNHEHNFASPADPARSQSFSLSPGVRAKNRKEHEISIRDFVQKKFEQGEISCRDDVIREISQQKNYEVTRTGKEYITVHNTELDQKVRVKGDFYEQNFRSIESLERKVGREYKPDIEPRREEFREQIEIKAEYLRGRFGENDIPTERDIKRDIERGIEKTHDRDVELHADRSLAGREFDQKLAELSRGDERKGRSSKERSSRGDRETAGRGRESREHSERKDRGRGQGDTEISQRNQHRSDQGSEGRDKSDRREHEKSPRLSRGEDTKAQSPEEYRDSSERDNIRDVPLHNVQGQSITEIQRRHDESFTRSEEHRGDRRKDKEGENNRTQSSGREDKEGVSRQERNERDMAREGKSNNRGRSIKEEIRAQEKEISPHKVKGMEQVNDRDRKNPQREDQEIGGGARSGTQESRGNRRANDTAFSVLQSDIKRYERDEGRKVGAERGVGRSKKVDAPIRETYKQRFEEPIRLFQRADGDYSQGISRDIFSYQESLGSYSGARGVQGPQVGDMGISSVAVTIAATLFHDTERDREKGQREMNRTMRFNAPEWSKGFDKKRKR